MALGSVAPTPRSGRARYRSHLLHQRVAILSCLPFRLHLEAKSGPGHPSGRRLMEPMEDHDQGRPCFVRAAWSP